MVVAGQRRRAAYCGVHTIMDNAINTPATIRTFKWMCSHRISTPFALNIRDRGIGIPRVELKRIFNRFYRVENTSAGHVRGQDLACLSCAR